MHFVGVDLAWGARNPTGVAVLDDAGTLREVGVARDDAEVLGWLQPWTDGACVVAFDAPLVVTNATGNRACEAALNRDFRRFDAGTHPSNTGLAWFADGGRAARLCAALDLDPDPASRSPRRALEVYPHAASVALFGLHRTLKYKQKTGRDLELLRSELLRFMDLIEGLHSAQPGLEVGTGAWAHLRQSVRSATSKAAVRRAEDPIDAVLCAYIARFAATRPEAVTVYGDAASGCIVTPSLPAELRSRSSTSR